MDSLLSQLNPWTTALNEKGSAFAASVSGTSTTSVLVGTGSKSLTVQSGLGFVPGMDVVIAYTTTPTTRMLCTVTSYNSTTGALVVSSYSATGSGTYTAWTVSFTSAVDPVQFVTPTGSQTLTNKTLTAPAISDATLSGTNTAPTAAAGTNTTQLATTAHVFAERTNTATLTSKTINLASNTLTGTLAQFNAAVSDADLASLAGVETLTNKTINLTSNTLTGTLAQFNTAVSDADFASLAGSETLTNKTLTTPVITFTNNAAVSAAGTTQGTATELTVDYNNVTTVAASAGVVLPVASGAGRKITVKNNGANPLTVYPPSTGAIDALGTNVGLILPVGSVEVFLYTSTVNMQTLEGSQINVTLTGLQTLTNKSLTTPGLTFTNSTAVSAAGTTQGTATVLTLDYNNVTTVAANAGVTLPISAAGRLVTVKNNGANPLTVYPPSGGQIEAFGVNAGILVEVGEAEAFSYTSTINMYLTGRKAGRVKMTATGAISSGQVVVLNNDSTVSAVGYSLAAGTLGAEQTFSAINATTVSKIVEVAGTNKHLIFYNGTSVVCATVDPVTSTTTFGTPVTTGAWGSYMDACWYPTDSQAVVAYNNAGALTAVTVSLSGTTVTINTPVSAGAASMVNNYPPCMAYNTQQNRVCVAYYNASGGMVRVLTIAAGAITWQSAYSLGGNYVYGIAENPGTSVMLVLFYVGGYFYATAVTVNANVCTIGAAYSTVVTQGGNAYHSPIIYAQAYGKFVALIRDGTYTARYAVLSVSGTSVTWNKTPVGLPTGYAAANTADAYLTYDGSNGKIILFSQDNSTNKYAQVASCTIDGSNNLIASTPVVVNVTTSSTLCCAYSNTNSKLLLGFQDAGDNNYGHTRVWDSGDSVTNANNWIGIASAAISNGASGYIDVIGGVSNAVSGLTPGYTYFIDDTGALQQSGSRIIGRAITATKLQITGAA
jgi:hypothetical protein